MDQVVVGVGVGVAIVADVTAHDSKDSGDLGVDDVSEAIHFGGFRSVIDGVDFKLVWITERRGDRKRSP